MWVLGVGGRGERGLDADVSVEELGRVVVAANRVVLGVLFGGPCVFRLGYWDFGDDCFEFGDELCEVLVGCVVERDARVSECVNHRLDDELACAVDDGRQPAKGV